MTLFPTSSSKPWPNGLESLENQNLHTSLRWVDKRIRKSACKFTKVAKSWNFTHIQLTCDQLASTCVQIWAQPNSEVNTSGWPNEMQVESKLKTCIDLQVHWARAFNSLMNALAWAHGMPSSIHWQSDPSYECCISWWGQEGNSAGYLFCLPRSSQGMSYLCSFQELWKGQERNSGGCTLLQDTLRHYSWALISTCTSILPGYL